LILKIKRQSRLLTYVNSYSETFSADALLLKVKYGKFSGNLPVIYGNSNIPNLTGNFRTLLLGTVKMILLPIGCVLAIYTNNRL